MAVAQELVPRRWSHVPIGTNFVGLGYAYTRGDIAFDPVLQIEETTMDLHTIGLGYIRTLELFDKTARVECKVPYQEAHWEGLLSGQPASAHRSGLADPIVRVALNLLGGPPLKGKEFAAYRAATDVETTVGLGLATHLPLGQYDETKLLNLGSNRFTLRPQLGLVHQRGKWTGELTGSVWFFTDNDSFYNGTTREQDPLYTTQAHLIYTLRPGFWASASGGWGYGGRNTIDGVGKNDKQRNLAWALSLGAALTRHFGLQFNYVSIHNRSDIGADTDTVILGATYFW
ncbi:transporter [Planctomycetota bacterium]